MKKQIFCIIFLSSIFIVYGFPHTTQLNDSTESLRKIEHRFDSLFLKGVTEKVYLKTDKSSYLAGETIWFRAFVSDATYHIPNALSHLLYVELRSNVDQPVKRVLIRMTDSLFCGNITLPDTLRAGRYTLSSFTNRMQTDGADYFFSKEIDVFNASAGVNLQTVYSREGDESVATISFIDNNGLPIVSTTVLIDSYRKNRLTRSRTYKTKDDGSIDYRYRTSDSLTRAEISFYKELPYRFETTLILPRLDDDFEVTLFPEGGHLLNGVSQKVAFKAVDPNGHSLSLTGRILSSQKETISTFRTKQRGMGLFEVTSPYDQETMVEFISEKGIRKTYPLPKPLAKGYALALDTVGDTHILSIRKAEQTAPNDSLRLLFHTRGNLLGVMEISSADRLELHEKDFPAGILHAVLLTSANTPISERLIFIRPHSNISTHFSTDQAKYGRWQDIQAKVSVSDADGNPLQGDFAVSVTDDNYVHTDSTENNLITHYLLQSDLRGEIEEIGCYDRETPEHLDLLMRTHGWTRFSIDEVLNKTKPTLPTYEIEKDQTITGYVQNEFFDPIKNGTVMICANEIGVWGKVQADRNGFFTVRGLNFPDSTMILFRGTKQKGGKYGIKIKIEEPRFLTKSIRIKPHIAWKQDKASSKNEDQFKGNYIIQNGQKVYILKEFEVRRGSKYVYKDDDVERELKRSSSVINVQEASKQFPNASVFDLIRRLPRIYVVNGKIYSSNPGGNELDVYINGLKGSSEELVLLEKEYLETIAFANGGISIRTNEAYFNRPKDKGLLKYYPLGFLIPSDFYVPNYQLISDQIRDKEQLRRTLYWSPSLKLDNNGSASFTFPTSDKKSTYTVFYEGVTRSGELFKGKGLIEVE